MGYFPLIRKGIARNRPLREKRSCWANKNNFEYIS